MAAKTRIGFRRGAAVVDSAGRAGRYGAMNVLVIGSGGREHALCRALGASPLCDRILCAPGNGGIAADAECVALDVMDFAAAAGLCRARGVDFVVVGPEAPLAAGIVDALEGAGFPCFGPTAAAARLEGSKVFAKELCRRRGVPTADFAAFDDVAAARAHLRRAGAPIVVKASGLAAGKGVTVARTLAEAEAALDVIAAGAFGAAGSEVVIEEVLDGEEASLFALVDGAAALPLAGAQDHKAAGDGDTGPNTGGMGAYSPAPALDEAMTERAMAEIVRPTVAAMAEEGAPFRGVLYAGLMITESGPKLLEFNARFGDPECQVLVRRLKSDLLPALLAARDGELAHFDLRWRDDAAVCVVMAAKGYPGAYEKGGEIAGLDDIDDDSVEVFYAGAELRDGRIVAAGGRVLGVTATGPTVTAARAAAYRAIDRIDWPGGFCRRDIGWRAAARESQPR